ncbi:hypothetical protein [Nonomuraea sp. NPDC049480]|uniref:hypothetical protein n=1 Tax=Nonomuraea sp. NPDC049480 TaxID=3364353 RepID=UPI003790C7A8
MIRRLTACREDGTLLRAKATPHGMPAYLAGKVMSIAGGLLADLAIFLVPGMLIVEGLRIGPGSWPTPAWAAAPACRTRLSASIGSPPSLGRRATRLRRCPL